MNSILRRPALLLFGVVMIAGCSSSNHLQNYNFEDQTVAVIAAVPPRPVITSSSGEAWASRFQPVRSAVRVGTYLAKRGTIKQAQARLDSALQFVDVAERIAKAVAGQNKSVLGYRTTNRPREADFLLDVRIYDYGIVADSWEAATYFVLRGEVLLIDNETKRPIWKEKLREREEISGSVFGLGATAGNIITARILSKLSVEEMGAGLKHLADFTANRVTHELREDFFASREE